MTAGSARPARARSGGAEIITAPFTVPGGLQPADRRRRGGGRHVAIETTARDRSREAGHVGCHGDSPVNTTNGMIWFLLGLVLGGCSERDAPPAPAASAASATAEASPPGADGFTPAVEPAWPSRIVVDGHVEDWPAEAAPLADPTGDAPAPFDVTWLRAAREGDQLFVSFAIAAEANLYAGDGEGLVLVVEGDRRVRVDFRKRRVEIDGRRKRWADLDAVVAPSHAARQFELALRFPGPARVRLEGADEVGPVVVTPRPAPPAPPRSMARPPGTALRIASLNTDRAGIVDAKRGPALRRLIDAVDADVVCLQELAADRAAIDRALSGRHLHVTRGSGVTGNAVASRRPLRPIDMGSPRLAAAQIEDALVVVSVHLPCCGHLGSPQDDARLAVAARLTAKVDAVRRGAIEGVPPDAAIVVAGDFNDVGARRLRAHLARADLTIAPLTHLARPATFTWRKARSPFPPSTLDLVFHDPKLRRLGGFVLDTAELDEATLRELRLERADSLASDHRLVVVDLAR